MSYSSADLFREVPPLHAHGHTPHQDAQNDSTEEMLLEWRRQFNIIDRLEIVQRAGVDGHKRPIVVLTACRLPLPGVLQLDLLWQYILEQLEKVASGDYVLVYFHAGMPPESQPSMQWFYRVWLDLDQKFKKNLKALYIVHPTFWVRTFASLTRPFVSPKSLGKLVYCCTLRELDQYIPLAQLDLAPEVIDIDEIETARLAPMMAEPPPPPSHPPSHGPQKAKKIGFCQQFGVPLCMLVDEDEPIPLVLRQTADHLRKHGTLAEGLFRRCANVAAVERLKEMYNDGVEVKFQPEETHIAAVLFKTFLRELPDPLLTYDMFERIFAVCTIAKPGRIHEMRDIVFGLPLFNRKVLEFVVGLMQCVASHADVNLMTPQNLTMVMAPNLIWSDKRAASLELVQRINLFVHDLYVHADAIFVQPRKENGAGTPTHTPHPPPPTATERQFPSDSSAALNSASSPRLPQTPPTAPPPRENLLKKEKQSKRQAMVLPQGMGMGRVDGEEDGEARVKASSVQAASSEELCSKTTPTTATSQPSSSSALDKFTSMLLSLPRGGAKGGSTAKNHKDEKPQAENGDGEDEKRQRAPTESKHTGPEFLKFATVLQVLSQNPTAKAPETTSSEEAETASKPSGPEFTKFASVLQAIPRKKSDPKAKLKVPPCLAPTPGLFSPASTSKLPDTPTELALDPPMSSSVDSLTVVPRIRRRAETVTSTGPPPTSDVCDNSGNVDPNFVLQIDEAVLITEAMRPHRPTTHRQRSRAAIFLPAPPSPNGVGPTQGEISQAEAVLPLLRKGTWPSVPVQIPHDHSNHPQSVSVCKDSFRTPTTPPIKPPPQIRSSSRRQFTVPKVDLSGVPLPPPPA